LLAAAASGVLPPEAALHLVAELSRDASQRPSPNAHDASGESLGRLQVSLPRIPMISSATCAPYPNDEEAIAEITTWKEQSNGAFAKALRALQATGANLLLQIGAMVTFLVRHAPLR